MKRTVSTLILGLLATTALAEPNPMRNAYFGETHMHTALSLDAYIGGARLMPSDSLRFAKGGPVLVNGRHKQLKRPLDFAAVSDHVEYLGEMYSTIFPDAPGYDQEDLQKLRTLEFWKTSRTGFSNTWCPTTGATTRPIPRFTKGRKQPNQAGRSSWTRPKSIMIRVPLPRSSLLNGRLHPMPATCTAM